MRRSKCLKYLDYGPFMSDSCLRYGHVKHSLHFLPGGGYSGIFAYGYDDSCDLETHLLRNI